MKVYIITLTSLVNPTKDFDSEEPEVKTSTYEVIAEEWESALKKAKELHPDPVWESSGYLSQDLGNGMKMESFF